MAYARLRRIEQSINRGFATGFLTLGVLALAGIEA
jgi:hypothetical protein